MRQCKGMLGVMSSQYKLDTPCSFPYFLVILVLGVITYIKVNRSVQTGRKRQTKPNMQICNPSREK